MVLAEDLRQAVLQAALQGRLTEQLETDSNVDEMLKNIQKEKEKLIADKKIKKEKLLPEIQEEEIPFDIPESWKWVRLGNVGILTRGNGIKRNEITETGFPCIRYGELYTTYKTKFSVVISHTSKEIFDKSQKVNKDDILMALTGENNFDIALALAYVGDETIAMGGDLTRWSNHRMNSLYLVHVMNSSYAIHQKSKMAKGDIIVHISNDKLATILLPIPPIEEQQRIVDKINEIMPKIDEYEKIEKELEALKRAFPIKMKDALLQAALQGKLTEQSENDSSVDELLESIKKEKEELIVQKKVKKEKPLSDIEEEEIPFDIPENWRWVRWGNLVDSIQYGYNAPAKNVGKIKMLRISDVQDNSVNWDSVPYCDIKDEEIETYLLKKNDILFARTGGTVGKSFLVKNISVEAIYAGYLIRTRYNERLVPEYLKFFMESQLYWVQLQNGKTQGCQPNCNGQTLSKMLIPLSPIEEQQRIVEILETLLPLCEDLKEK